MVTTKISTVLGITIGFLYLTSSLQPAEATILSFSGNASKNSIVGVNLDNGGFENNSLVVGFDELQGVIIPTPVAVDYLISVGDIGTQFTGIDDPLVNSPQLEAGKYNSHILHFDPVTFGGSVTNASFTFDKNIIAIIANTTFQVNTDPIFGAAAAYNLDIDRRSESLKTLFTITSSNTIQIDKFVIEGNFIDNLRVITAASVPEESTSVPEPSTILGLLSVFGFRAFLRTRKSVAKS